MNKPRKKVKSQPVFCPIFDRDLSVIGYEPTMRNKDVLRYMNTFSEAERMGGVDSAGMILCFREAAIENYCGNLPLFLYTSFRLFERDSNSSPLPTDRKLVLTFSIVDFPLDDDKFMLEHTERLSAEGVQFAIDDFGFSRLSLPFLLRLRPQYIRLAKEVVESCRDDNHLNAVNSFLQPLRDMGIQIIAPGIESQEIYDRMLLVADAFHGSWLTHSHIQSNI